MGERVRVRRRRASALGVFGELLITVGALTLLFVAWQMWIGDAIYGAERNASGQQQSQVWEQQFLEANPRPQPTGSTAPLTAEPISMTEPADAVKFGVMHIPRFGKDYAVDMAGGVTRANTLDPIGIGHYPGTDMPGDVGNFAVAAHRTTWGKPFNRIADLHVGDAIVIETKDGWYTYRFRTLEYVRPDAVEVLLPVPQQIDVEATDSYLTMTSCSPMFSMTERIVGYSVFESFTPRGSGAPLSLTEGVAA